jgi:hypothetical protein
MSEGEEAAEKRFYLFWKVKRVKATREVNSTNLHGIPGLRLLWLGGGAFNLAPYRYRKVTSTILLRNSSPSPSSMRASKNEIHKPVIK